MPTATSLMTQIVTNYLYGSLTIPVYKDSEALIRSISAGSSVNIGASSHMLYSAGRFATPNQFLVIKEFFDSSNAIPAGTYTFSQILTQLGIAGGPTSNNTVQIFQSQYDDGGGDFLERVFVFNTENYEIDLSANPLFSVATNGDRSIQNLRIAPQNDNWDFKGGNAETNELNKALRAFIDPSDALDISPGSPDDGIGRKVDILYTGTAPIRSNYTQSNFDLDTFVISNSTVSSTYMKTNLGPYMALSLQEWWDGGLTKFVSRDQQPILYGTESDDIIFAQNIDEIYTETNAAAWFGSYTIDEISELVENGTLILAGKGNDTITGSEWNDVLDGGEGNDIVTGLAGFDLVDYKRFSYWNFNSSNPSRFITSYQITEVNKASGHYEIDISYSDSLTEHDEIASVERIAHAERQSNSVAYQAQLQNNSTIARVGDGYVVLWEGRSQGGKSIGIFGQVHDESGNGLGEFQVSTGGGSGQYDPRAIETNSGGFIVVWEQRGTGNYLKTFAKFYDSTGAATTGDIEVFKNRPTTDPQYNFYLSQEGMQDVAMLSGGGFVVVYSDEGGRREGGLQK